jgi:hypothetical protein
MNPNIRKQFSCTGHAPANNKTFVKKSQSDAVALGLFEDIDDEWEY